MSDRMLEKVSKLLNQAENASTPEEAEAFMERVQTLASANAIDLAVARAHQADRSKREVPEKRTVRIRQTWKQTPTDKWLVELFLAVAEANDCKVLIGGTGLSCYPHGMPSDLDVVEALYTSLAVQMVQAADAALKRGDNKRERLVPKQRRVTIPDDERAWGEYINDDAYTSNRHYAESVEDHERWGSPLPPSTRLEIVRGGDGMPVMERRKVSVVDGRVFRQNFYETYIARLRSRLWEAKRKAEREAGVVRGDESNETGLVLRSKALEVGEFLAVEVGDRKLGSYTSPEVQTEDHTGLARASGRRAAEGASLGTAREMGRDERAAIGSDR